MAPRKTNVPDWARKIQQLRSRLNLSQTGFGSRLHYSAMAVSRWESGKQEPPTQCYIQLGSLAGEPDCWVFWSRAGLKSTDLSKMFPEGRASLNRAKPAEIEVVINGGGAKRKSNPKSARIAGIPILPIHAGTRGEVGDPNTNLDLIAPEEMIGAPFEWCPNPGETACMRVKGTSMSPTLGNGDLIAVDYSQTDPTNLSGKIVVAWHRESGLQVSRFLFAHGVQMLDSDNREHPPIVLEKDRNWEIIGKVLWWVRRAP